MPPTFARIDIWIVPERVRQIFVWCVVQHNGYAWDGQNDESQGQSDESTVLTVLVPYI